MNNLYFSVLILAVVVAFTGCKSESAESINYPASHRGTVADQYFGKMVEDPYRWLEYENNEEVKKWIDDENAITQNYLNQIPFRPNLAERLKTLWNYTRQTAPNKEGENYFFYKNDGLQNQSVLYIQKGESGKPEVFLDPNALSKDGTTSITTTSVSKDGKWFAYGLSKAGSDWNEFFVRDIATGKDNPEKLEWVKFSGAAWWGNGFFYTRFPEPKKGTALSASNTNSRIYYHKAGTPQSQDSLVFEYPQDPLIGLGASTSEDEKYLFVDLSKGASDNSAIYYKNLTKKDTKLQPLISNYDNAYNFLGNDGDNMIFLTDKGAPKRRIILINPAKPDEKNWKVIVPEQENTIQSAKIFGDKLFCTMMVDAKHQIKVFSMKGNESYDVQIPGIGSVGGFTGKREDTVTYFTFTSFTQPTAIYKYNILRNTSSLHWKPETKFASSEYETKQVFYQSKDGTKIPMFITHKKGITLNGDNPTYLYGYGGFNISILPSYATHMLPFLEKGGVYAVVTLRGGGEYGEEWHAAGMRDKKQNVFDDFIGAAEFLIKEKYTSNKKLCISGRSNGGLLVGACMTQRPDLFGVALPAVGVMDMLRFHRFTIGHAWTVEYGCADSSVKQFETLYKYSPYHNLKKDTHYPATMVTTADHDDRVVPAHSFKFAANLQHNHKGENPVLIRIETSAGHGSGKSTTKQIEEWADVWAFVLHNMGVNY
ncbi:MAG: prolyl oligopeptidase family serine peptidase [Bacteroidia bacterium]|nr:prolyl oligopeptidase family serine peptidase [Bacteroidia bacterium]